MGATVTLPEPITEGMRWRDFLKGVGITALLSIYSFVGIAWQENLKAGTQNINKALGVPRLTGNLTHKPPLIEGTDWVWRYPKPGILNGTFVEMEFYVWNQKTHASYRRTRTVESTTVDEEWRVQLTALPGGLEDRYRLWVIYTLVDANGVRYTDRITSYTSWPDPN